MARTMWSRTWLVAVALVASGALLAGCASAPGLDGSLPGTEATPQQTDSAETGDIIDPTVCLIGTWQEDMEALTKTGIEEMKKSGSLGDLKVKWSGGAFLRFDDRDMFFVWTEDGTFESWMGDIHAKTITNSSSFGDYVVEGDVIHWSNYSTLSSELVTYVDGQIVEGIGVDDMEGFSIPGAFTCTKDRLEVNTGSSQLTIPHFYDRVG